MDIARKCTLDVANYWSRHLSLLPQKHLACFGIYTSHEKKPLANGHAGFLRPINEHGLGHSHLVSSN